MRGDFADMEKTLGTRIPLGVRGRLRGWLGGNLGFPRLGRNCKGVSQEGRQKMSGFSPTQKLATIRLKWIKEILRTNSRCLGNAKILGTGCLAWQSNSLRELLGMGSRSHTYCGPS